MFRVVLSDSDSDSGTRKGCFVVKRTHCAGHPGQVRGSLWTGNRQCLPTLTTVVHVALLSFEPPPKHPFLLLLFVCFLNSFDSCVLFVNTTSLTKVLDLRCLWHSSCMLFFSPVGSNSGNLQAFKAQTCFSKMIKPTRHNSM